MTNEHPAATHFTRVWDARHDDTVTVFADGTVFDREARRATVRANINAQRSYREYTAQ